MDILIIRNKPLHRMQHLIDFQWFRDSKGYVLQDELKAPEPKGARTVLSGFVYPRRIERKGGKKCWYNPILENPGLFREFADLKTEFQLLKFAERYGMLTNAPWEDVDTTLAEAKQMNIVAKKKEAFDVTLTHITAALSFRKGGKGYLFRLTPKTLSHALWLQLWLQKASGSDIYQCQLCHQWFERGAGAGRRAGAIYCSDKHRIQFNSTQRSIKTHHNT